MAEPTDIRTLDEIVAKVAKARERGVHVVVVWRPNCTDNTSGEALPDGIITNVDDPKLVTAMLGHRGVETGGDATSET